MRGRVAWYSRVAAIRAGLFGNEVVQGTGRPVGRRWQGSGVVLEGWPDRVLQSHFRDLRRSYEKLIYRTGCFCRLKAFLALKIVLGLSKEGGGEPAPPHCPLYLYRE